MDKQSMKLASQLLMFSSLAAITLSAVGYLGYDIWLASTQWLLVASILALFGVYMRLNQ